MVSMCVYPAKLHVQCALLQLVGVTKFSMQERESFASFFRVLEAERTNA